jgi:hypothetical protein
MSLSSPKTAPGVPAATRRRTHALRLSLAALLGLAAALLVACGTSGKNLIPAADAGPLQSDFETVQQAAENGDGSCAATEAALLKTNEDFTALPTTVDAGLRSNLSQGIDNLRSRALALCAQPLPQSTTTTAAPKTTTTNTTPTTTTPTTTTPTTTETTPTTTEPPPTSTTPGGGTPAPGVGETPPGGQGGGTGAGEAGAGTGAGASETGAVGQGGGQ